MIRATDLPSFPLGIYLELTDKCNLSCKMCRPTGYKGDIIPFDVFCAISDSLFPHASFVDLRGWGESTILSNFEDYLDISLQFPVRIKLITNATLSNPNLWYRLGSEGVLTGISFDAADEDTYRKIRGGADIKQVIENIETIVAGNKAAGHTPHENIYFCITAGGQNISQIADIVVIGCSLGIKRFKLEPLWAPDNDPNRLEFHKAKVRRTYEFLKQVKSKYPGVRIELSSSLLKEDTIQDAIKKVCIHPFCYLYVNARGKLGFCDHLNGREEYTWGEWNGLQGFKDFWHGKKMERFRKEHRDALAGKTIETCPDCNWCYERRYSDLEQIIVKEWEKFVVEI